MNARIVEKSKEWKDAILSECLKFSDGVEVGSLPLLEQLQLIFDDEVGEETDEQFRKRITREYDLHVTIEKGDISRISETLRDSYRLCEEIVRLLPTSLSRDINPQLINKAAYGFAQRGEQAIYAVYRNTNASIVELYVRTANESCEELIYWAQNKLFIMHFVPELDEEFSISTVGSSPIVYFE